MVKTLLLSISLALVLGGAVPSALAVGAAGVDVHISWVHLPRSKTTILCARIKNVTKEYFSHPDASLSTGRLKKGEARLKQLGPLKPGQTVVERWNLNLVNNTGGASVVVNVSTKIGETGFTGDVRPGRDGPFGC
jgi:hypothetical protein